MRVLITVMCVSTVLGYRHFQNEIPNGRNVVYLCQDNDVWEGLGHQNPLGGGALNPFGVDFRTAGMKWTQALCETDSDGDGLTNGAELGDPDCVWTKGKVPTTSTSIGHPGICSPQSAPACQAANRWIDCDVSHQCDVLKEQGIKSLEVRIPETVLPPIETHHLCMFAELPSDDDYHLVATEPLIDNSDIVHHILLYGCDSTENTNLPLNIPMPCGMDVHPQCGTMMDNWLFGSTGGCMYKNSGFRIGKNGFRYVNIQIHWNNPQLRSDVTDKSGLKLYYTPNLRPYNARMMTVGSTYFEVPPGEEDVEVVGLCSSECTSRYFSGPIYITKAMNHMHLIGRKQKIQQYRNGVWIRDITNDFHSYNSYTDYEFPTPIEVKPGDEIKTTCTYRSIGRDKTTYFGEETRDEMCFGFLVVYPLENVKYQDCLSWKKIDLCKIRDFPSEFQEIDGCHFKNLLNPFHPDVIDIVTNLRTLCRPFDVCTKECKHYIRRTLASNKCFQGDVNDFLRRSSMDAARYSMDIWAAIDSCKMELEMEDCQGKCD